MISRSITCFLILFYSLFADETDSVLANNLEFWNAIQSTVATNPSYIASEHYYNLAKARYDGTVSNYLPNISANVSANHEYTGDRRQGSSSNPMSASITASQKIFDLSNIYSIKENFHIRNQAKHILESSRQSLILHSAQIYLDLISQLKAVELNEKNFKLTEKHESATRQRYTAGELTTTDVNQARTRLANARASLVRSLKVAEIFRKNYFQIVGKNPPKRLPVPQIDTTLFEDIYESRIKDLSDHPDILLAQASVEASEAEHNEAKADFLPSLSLGASATRTLNGDLNSPRDQQDSYSITLNLSVPIYSGGAKFHELKEKLYSRKAEVSNFESSLRSVRFALESAMLELNIARELEQVFAMGSDAARTALEGVEEEFQAGSRIALDVLDAQNELFSADISLLQSRFDIIKAQLSLMKALGVLTTDNLRMALSVKLTK